MCTVRVAGGSQRKKRPERGALTDDVQPLSSTVNMATFFEDGDPGCTADNWEGPSGSGNVNSFAPSALNVSQWVDSMVAIGVHEAVLTAKVRRHARTCSGKAWEV